MRRIDRKKLERQFINYTGHLDAFEMHVPYTRYDYMIPAMEMTAHHKGKKIIALVGDNLNYDLYSHYIRQGTSEDMDEQDPSQELDDLIKVLKIAYKIYDRIIFTRTNHDERETKIIMKNMPERKQAEQIIRKFKTIPEIFETHGINDKVVHVPGIYFQVGDIALCHFENNNSIPGGTSRNIAKQAVAKMNPSVNVIYQAHTHYQSKIWAFRKCVIEMGAISDIQDYARGDKMMGVEKTITIGYAVGELHNGKADVNQFNPVCCEIEGYL
jgi:hypothetical protein